MAEKPNKYGETGEAARLRIAYDREKDPGKKAALRTQLGAARSAAGVTRGAGSKGQGGFLGNMPKNFNWNPDTAGQAGKGQQQLNEYNALLNANLNRVNETTPFGSSEYTQNPDGTWSRNTTLAPEQDIVNKYQTLTDQSKFYGAFQKSQEAERALQTPYSLNGQPKVLGADDMLGARQRVEDQLYNSFARRNEPMFQQQQTQLEQRMADRGIPMGAQQYSTAFRDLNQQQNDARLNAQAQAAGQGLGEMQGLHGMSLTNRQQGIGEYEAQRYAPMNESNMFLQNSRGVVTPQVQGMTQVDVGGVDLAGTHAAYQKPTGGGGGGGGGGRSFSSLGNLQGNFLQGYAGGGGGQSNQGGWANIATGVANGLANGVILNQNRANKSLQQPGMQQPKKSTGLLGM